MDTFYQEYRRILPGCPLQILRERTTEEGQWEITLFNSSLGAVQSAALEVDFGSKTQALTVGSVPAQAEGSFTFACSETAAQQICVTAVYFTDGVKWENSTKKTGVQLPPPTPADTERDEQKAFLSAWQGTQPLYKPEFSDTYWSCGCGRVNAPGQAMCGGCGRKRTWVSAHADQEACLKTEQAERKAAQAEADKQHTLKLRKQQKRNRLLLWGGVCGGAVLFAGLMVLLNFVWFRPAGHYHKAERYLLLDNYFKAYQQFCLAGGYGDAPERALDMQRALCRETTVSAGNMHTVKTNDSGKVEGVGRNDSAQLITEKWNSICAVSAGENHTLGLHFSGTVMAAGLNEKGECNVGNWKDITAIGAGDGLSVGLKKDGSIVSAGKNDYGQRNLSEWSDIRSIAVGKDFVLGLKGDGTVLFAGHEYGNIKTVSEWSDIVYIAAGYNHAVGVKADGSVVAAGDDTAGALDVSGWSDVIAVTAGEHFTVGLKQDGTLLACGINQNGQTSVDDARDAVAVISGWDYTITIQKDGTLVFFGSDARGEGLVGSWTLN